MKGLNMAHHSFIYQLYLFNPSFPLVGYVEEIQKTFGLEVSTSLIQQWFNTIGPFKGTMRATSRYPTARNSLQTYIQVCEYLDFMSQVDHQKLVFSDEKPMKDIMVYRTVRRNPLEGDTPAHNVKK